MVEKITQPITPLEQVNKINEIIECVAEFDGSGVDKSTTNGILKKQVSESHHPIIENNNGTIILKAGSKLYVGGNLRILTIEEDLDISNVGDLPQGTKDYAIVLFGYNSDYHDSVGGVPVEVLGKPLHNYYISTVSYRLGISYPEYKPMYSSGTYSATLPICIVKTDGTVEPYIKDVYQIGDTCLVFKDSLKVSIPNGRNPDGTLNNLIVSSIDSTLTDISGTDKIYIDSTGALQKSSNCEYNQHENYNKADGSNVLYAKIGDFSSIDDVIQVVTKEDLKSVVNYNNISNCITHITQDIKLELNGNELTLKAGSKIYVPNNFEEDGTTPYFNEVITDTDITSTSSWTTNQLYVFIKPDTKTPVTVVAGNVYSGTSAPSSPSNGCVWYDTTNNVIKRYADSVWTSGFALPICIVSMVSGTGFTSIDRVFNGVGYFGSTVYVLPNTKVLFPNGKNEDGSNKNIEYTETGVRLTTNTSYNTSPSVFFGSVTFFNHDYLGEFKNPPSIKSYAMYYNTSENLLYKNGNGGYWEVYPNMMYLGTIFDYSTNIRSANFKNTFQSLDVNNQFGLTRLGIPDYSKASSVTAGAYTATRDCVVYIVTTDKSGSISHTIYVDGVSVAVVVSDYNVHQCTPVYLKQNSKLTMSSYGNVNAYRVVPLFGAN